METREEIFVEDFKVEVKEEDVGDVGSVGVDDPLSLEHHTAWRDDDSQVRHCFPDDRTVTKCVDNMRKEDKKHYFSKLRMKDCEIPDPYKLEDWMDSMKEWPDLHSGHVHQYLLSHQDTQIHNRSPATLYGYECFRTGNVMAVKYHPISSNCPVCFLKAKVVPAFSVTAEALEPWICLHKTEGTVQSSHCTCIKGLREVCSHIAGLLFKVEAAVSLGMNKEEFSSSNTSSSSSKFEVWNKYYSSKNHIARVVDIDFSHPNKPKKSKRPMKRLKPLPLSPSEQDEALRDLKKILPNAIIFTEDHSDTDSASEPEQDDQSIPLDLQDSPDLETEVKVEEVELMMEEDFY